MAKLYIGFGITVHWGERLASSYKTLVHCGFALDEALTVIDPLRDHVTYERIQGQAERVRAALAGDAQEAGK